MKLTNPTNDELNVAFAEHVACRPISCETGEAMMQMPCTSLGFEAFSAIPPFSTSMDAILPHLEKWMIENPKSTVDLCLPSGTKRVTLFHGKTRSAWSADSHSFPRSAVITLLRAHGVEVEFTPPY